MARLERAPGITDAAPAERSGGMLTDEPAPELADLPLATLRLYRRTLADEEDRVSYWRRLLHARIDLLEAGTPVNGELSVEKLADVLGDTGTGRTRTALVRVSTAEPLPELPVLEEMWSSEIDSADAEQVAQAVERLRTAERQLTSYRKALHQRIDEATAELIDRYKQDPSQALTALRGHGPTNRRPVA